MLSLSPATRVFLALAPIDGRKGFNGLYTMVRETLQQEPTSGFLFIASRCRRRREFEEESPALAWSVRFRRSPCPS